MKSKYLFILPSIALCFASCSTSRTPTKESTTIRALKVAAPTPTERVSLDDIKESANTTAAKLGEVSDQVVKLKTQSEQAERLNVQHTSTINKLSSQLEDKDVEIQITLTELKDEVQEYTALDLQRQSAIKMLEAVLAKAQQELEDLRLTHVPRTELKALAGELEKAKLREVGEVSTEIVSELEGEVADLNKDVVKYKVHYDTRWVTYLKVSIISILVFVGAKLLLRLYLRTQALA